MRFGTAQTALRVLVDATIAIRAISAAQRSTLGHLGSASEPVATLVALCWVFPGVSGIEEAYLGRAPPPPDLAASAAAARPCTLAITYGKQSAKCGMASQYPTTSVSVTLRRSSGRSKPYPCVAATVVSRHTKGRYILC